MDDFTLLMAVYAQDEDAFVRAAYLSATRDQELPPTHGVVVQDGPVSPAVAAWLDEITEDPRTTVVRLPRNLGLAAALNAGLTHVRTDIVARADADDICLPQRFATQVPMIAAGLDLVGSAIAELSDDPHAPQRLRRVRTTQAEIEQQARLESPFHHPSVVFRKSAVLRAGGYPSGTRMEDYLLWVNMLMSGAKVANCDQVLVLYRTNAGAFARRGGAAMARSEADLQRYLRLIGFTTRWQYLRNRVVRGPLYRYLPSSLRRVAYRLWKSSSSHPTVER